MPEGVESYRKQARVFRKLVATIEGVSDVLENMQGDRQIVELKCKCTGEELMARLFAVLETAAEKSGLRDLEVVTAQKNRFILTVP